MTDQTAFTSDFHMEVADNLSIDSKIPEISIEKMLFEN